MPTFGPPRSGPPFRKRGSRSSPHLSCTSCLTARTMARPTSRSSPSQTHGTVRAAGADDAITASSDGAVFAARVRALLRRAQRWQTGQSEGAITVRDLVIDLDKCEVALRGRPVPLTPTELRLLAVLAAKAGKVLDARTLLSSVHRPDYDDREAQNLVKVHIANLRRKL